MILAYFCATSKPPAGFPAFIAHLGAYHTADLPVYADLQLAGPVRGIINPNPQAHRLNLYIADGSAPSWIYGGGDGVDGNGLIPSVGVQVLQVAGFLSARSRDKR